MSRSTLSTVLFVACAALASALHAGIARACVCAPPGGSLELMPADGMFAPRNTRIWISHGVLAAPQNAGLSVLLFDEHDALVPTTRSEILGASADRAGLIVLTPYQPLDATANYTIEVNSGSNGQLLLSATFHTTEFIDLAAPDVPAVVDADVDPGGKDSVGDCGDEPSLGLVVSADAWVLKRDASMHAGATFDPERMSGSLEDFAANTTGNAMLGYGGACNFAPWHRFPAAMEFATLDLAGNFSGWSATQHFAPVAAQDCSVGGPGTEPPYSRPGACLTGAAFALLVVRRRRRALAERARSRPRSFT